MISILSFNFLTGLVLAWIVCATGWIFYSITSEYQIFASHRLKPRLYSHPKACKNILACRPIADTFPSNLLAPLDARARPNVRLVHVFGIDNAFTTTHVSYQRFFRGLAKRKIEADWDDARWKQMATFACQLVKEIMDGRLYAGSCGSSEALCLVPMVQVLCMRLVLRILFDVDPKPTRHNDAIEMRLAAEINRLWSASKHVQLHKIPCFKDQTELRHLLQDLFPAAGLDNPKDNPLNLILPAYETLWRVVLRGFLEVRFRGHEGSQFWTQRLVSFLENPTQGMFESRETIYSLPRETAEQPPLRFTTTTSSGSSTMVSVRDLVRETLRLYPPTQRVYREYHYNIASPMGINSRHRELVAADIQALQRDPTIWGPDFETFDPSRWLPKTTPSISTAASSSPDEVLNSRKDAYLPFGGGPFLCPASESFAPRMIGVLIATLVEGTSRDHCTLACGPDSCDVERGLLDQLLKRREQPLAMGRSRYHGLVMRLKG